MSKLKDDKTPLYFRLFEEIKLKIKNGTFKKGDKIPSERSLCDMYNLSRITVRSAIDELVKQGFLVKVQGKGTFILSKSINQNLSNVYSFSNEMKKQEKITSTKIIKKEVLIPNINILYNLGLNKNDKVIYIERIRNEKNNVLMIEKTYFPFENFKFLLEYDFSKKGLYKTLEEDFNININRAIETFKACELTEYEMELLKPKNNKTFGLLVKRTSYCDEKIICYSTIVSKGDSFEFTVQLKS